MNWGSKKVTTGQLGTFHCPRDVGQKTLQLTVAKVINCNLHQIKMNQ